MIILREEVIEKNYRGGGVYFSFSYGKIEGGETLKIIFGVFEWL